MKTGPKTDPAVQRVIERALNDEDLWTAYQDEGEPTGWANILKHVRKARQLQAATAAEKAAKKAAKAAAAAPCGRA